MARAIEPADKFAGKLRRFEVPEFAFTETRQKLGLTKGLNIMAAKETPPATSAEREILPISPRSLKVDLTTQTRRYLIVELDPALVLQDLNDHADSLWRLVQRGQTPVGPHDVIEFRAADWTATAKVSSIDGDAVYLYDVHRASKPARTVGLYEDDDYAIRQVGVRFGVFRKKHDNVNPHGGLTYATVAEAKQFLFSQYPKHRVA